VSSVGTFVDVDAFSVFPFFSIRTFAYESAWFVDAVLGGVAVVDIELALVDVVALVGLSVQSKTGWTVFVANEAWVCVGTNFVVIAVVSIVVAFVDVDTFTVFFLVSLGTDAAASLFVAFSDKSGFAVAVVIAVCVFA
jgi:hypothetical protein